MKSAFLLVMGAQVQAASIFNMDVTSRLSQDFLTGFESGILSRDNT